MDIGKRLKEIRVKKNMTLSDIANKINSSTGFLSDIEHGKSIPSLLKLEAICNALGVELYSFFKTDDNNESTDISQIFRYIYDNVSESKLPISALVIKELINKKYIKEDETIPKNIQALLMETINLQTKLDNITKKNT